MRGFGVAVVLASAAVVWGGVEGAWGALIGIDGSEVPQYTNAPTNSTYFLGATAPRFHGVRFANCGVSSVDGVLTLSTVTGQGVWFGWHPSFTGSLPVGWSFANNAAGNEIRIRSRLGTVGSKEWGFYLHDGTHALNVYFHDRDTVELYVKSGGVDTSLLVNVDTGADDFSAWHDFRVMLKGGLVGYYMDGVPLYQGPAGSGSSPIMIVGDGSGTSISGVGSWQVDSFRVETSPAGVVPEAGSVGVLGAVGGLMLRRRRRR